MIVRPATSADAEEMARVHLTSANTAYGREDSLERRLAASRRVFEEDGVRPYVVEADGVIVGELIVGDSEVYAIYVHPDWWGRGAGQALIEQAHDLLAATCDEAELTCLADNVRARRFYERNGWLLDREVTEPHFGGVPTRVVKYRRRMVSDAEGV